MLDDVLDVGALHRTALQREPFDHVVIPGFIPRDEAAAIRACFPLAGHGGIEPAHSHAPGDPLDRLLAALRHPRTSMLFSELFGLDLYPETMIIHLRSQCRPQDGRIHTDSRDKLVTGLIYFNETWPHAGGKLRLLRSADDLEDMVGEVEPLDGTLVAFRRSDNSFHGHHPYTGIRRCIMFNWMVDAAVAPFNSLLSSSPRQPVGLPCALHDRPVGHRFPSHEQGDADNAPRCRSRRFPPMRRSP